MDTVEGSQGGESLSSNRSKRQRVDRTGRLAALQRLKQLKGCKNKYEIREEAPVYEEIDEREYSHMVQKRQEDDWIVDDDGSGYVEDGREIFDDDIDDTDSHASDRKRREKERKKFQPPSMRKPPPGKASDIKSLFLVQGSKNIKKKSENEVKIDDDDLLGDIMQEIHNDNHNICAPKPTILKRKSKMLSSPATPRASLNPFATGRTPTRTVQSREYIRPRSMTYDDDIPKSRENDITSKISKPIRSENDPKIRSEMNSNSLSHSHNGNVEYEENSSRIDEYDSQETDVFQNDKATIDENHLDSHEIEEFLSQDIFEEEKLSNEEKVESTVVTSSSPESNSNLKSKSKEENFEDLWEGCEMPLQNDFVATEVHVDSSNIPLTTNDKGEQVLKFFWIDAFEDYFKHPGIVYLFGKVWIGTAKTYVSCCVVVKNIERRIFLLPRVTHFDLKTKQDTDEPVAMKDVYLEFKESVAEKFKINEFKVKTSKKFYSFEKADVPDECEYLEVRYSASLPSLPSDLTGATFSCIFGHNTSSLEMLLMDRKLKGPGWIDVCHAQANNPAVSWCKIEALVTKPGNIVTSQGDVPPLVTLSLRLCTALNKNTHHNEIVAASCLVHHQFPLDKRSPSPPYQEHFCVLTRPSDCIFPFDFKDALAKYRHTKVERVDQERGLLVYLLAKIQKIDPDVIVGHDIFGFDLDILLHRMVTNKTPNWSRLGRLKRSGQPRVGGMNKGGHFDKHVTCGRLICDVKISAKELIRCKSYDLSELVHQVLHQQCSEVPSEDIRSMFSSSYRLLQLVDITMRDAEFVLRLMCELNILPLALQITTIAGNLMSRTLLGGRSERNEFLLLHAFHEKQFICPDKTFGKHSSKIDNMGGDDDIGELSRGSKRRKPAYAGGLVLEPKKGFYDTYILLMDFNSLYPSIIQEYNICFTTIPRTQQTAKEKEEDEEVNIELPDSSLEPGILPTEIRKLVESRRQVKQLMKASDVSAELKLQYDIRQKALKLTANSMYGCLGFTNSRFYAKPLAALITSQGRQILMRTKDLVQKMGLEVIYGDTDSIMINTNTNDFDQIMKLGNKVKNEINKLYRQLEIDIDGVFKSMLLLKKKKYAALSISRLPNGELTTTRELKGIDIVRRDWSELAKKAGEYVINEILSDKSRDVIVDNIHSHLANLSNAVKENKVALTDYTITKQLTKNPEDYPDKKNLSHVQVALRLNSRGGRKLRQGDTVAYIICEDGSKLSATQRAYHPDELKSNNLKIDTMYYLAQQIHPVVARLCDPIDGMDAVSIAEFLGLDPSGYRRAFQYSEHNEEDSLLISSDKSNNEEQFKDCERLMFSCSNEHCKVDIPVLGPFIIEGRKMDFSLDICPNASCGAKLYESIPSLCNQLSRMIRIHIQKYYQSWLICEDPSCQYQTKRIPLRFIQGGPLCSMCEKSVLKSQYTDAQLYLQLSYYSHLFDVDKARTSLPSSVKDSVDLLCNRNRDHMKMYTMLKNTVDRTLRFNAYAQVNLGWLFQNMYKSASITPMT